MKNRIKWGTLVAIVLAIWFYRKNTHTTQAPKEKVLVTVNEAKIKSLDPVQTNTVYDVREVSKLYEGLLEYHYLKRPHELAPNLAEAMPTVSEDGLVYTFQIKQGVRFHDSPCFAHHTGRELVAEDFVYALKRVADPKLQSPYFSILKGKIKGLDEWRKRFTKAPQTDYNKPVEGIQALDKYTLQFTLQQPYPQFLYILAMPCCYAVPQEAVQHYGQEFINHPVGTGPFTLEEFNPQANKIVYHKNPNFRHKLFPSEAAEEYKHMLADAGKPLPLVDKIITYILPEEQPRWLKFQKGQVDIIDISSDNIASEVIQAQGLAPEIKQKGVQLFYQPEVGTGFLVINSAQELFKNNIKLRQALSMAFDAQRYNELFHNGTALVAQSIIPPGLAGYQESYINPNRVYDLNKAKQLLAAAGYPGGQGLPVITLDVGATTSEKQKGEFFQKCMEQIGVQVKVIPNIFPELIKKISQKTTMMHAITWSGDYPDAENFLSLLYKSDKAVGIGAYLSSPAYNALYEQAVVMQPSAKRDAIYEQLNKIAAENVPAIYTVHRAHPMLYHAWVKNYLWSDFHYGTEQYLDIDLEKKHELQDQL
jgi:oligopeptide transport system substrate-binding protein